MAPSRSNLAILTCSIALLLAPVIARPQSAELEQRVVALKESVAQDLQRLRQYEWIETTVITVKGEERSRKQQQCYFGADGKLQKVIMYESAPPKEKFGLRGMIQEKKQEELKDYMEQAVAMIKEYVPPDPIKMLAVRAAGKVGMDMPGGGKGLRVNFRDYAKPGDLLTMEIDPASNRVLSLGVATYLSDATDSIALNVGFMALQDGTRYPATEVLSAPAKELTINVTNSGYRKH